MSQFSLEAMQALCSVLLSHSKSMTGLHLASCKISDEEAILLAAVLHRLKRLERLVVENNDIHDSGATAIAEALLGLSQLSFVDLVLNPISANVREALDKKTSHITWQRPEELGGGSMKVFHY